MMYDKMYYTVFNAVTDALEVAKGLPASPEKQKLVDILVQSQKASEELYLLQEGG